MTTFGRAMLAVPLACALVLAACSGGDTPSTPGQLAAQGIAVGEPNGGAPVLSEFVKMAQGESCAGIRNRLFVIDGKQVFWDRAGNCPDNSYAQALFGVAPGQVACQASDSIAGPRTSCADDKSRALFDTILKNLDKPDLGLAGHKVEQVPFLPKAGTPIAFETIASDGQSGVTQARTVVVKDAAAFDKLWAEHGKFRVPPPAMPKVDFSQQMVLAVFDGTQPTGCHAMSITRVGSNGDRIVVDYEERELATFAVCTAALVQPMQMVVVARNDAPVEFVKVQTSARAFNTIDQATRSGIGEARDVVVKDGATWAALWAEHAGVDTQVPAVDFDRQMVVGVFLGKQQNGCYSTTISNVSLGGNKLTVLHQDTVPGIAVLCTMAITTPAHLVVVERTDANVEFAKEVVRLQ
jgi:hypothetical protein